MKKENIIHYTTNEVTLMTGDCGISMDMKNYEFLKNKLHFAQILFILNNLPEGGNFVIKYYFPVIHPIQFCMLDILYRSFDKIYFFKGMINPYSREFYIIGKNYFGSKEELLKKLFKILENFSLDSDISNGKYKKSFSVQLLKSMKILSNNYIYSIERQLYYVDNIEIINKEYLDKINKFILKKNMEWANRNKLKKINEKDKL